MSQDAAPTGAPRGTIEDELGDQLAGLLAGQGYRHDHLVAYADARAVTRSRGTGPGSRTGPWHVDPVTCAAAHVERFLGQVRRLGVTIAGVNDAVGRDPQRTVGRLLGARLGWAADGAEQAAVAALVGLTGVVELGEAAERVSPAMQVAARLPATTRGDGPGRWEHGSPVVDLDGVGLTVWLPLSRAADWDRDDGAAEWRARVQVELPAGTISTGTSDPQALTEAERAWVQAWLDDTHGRLAEMVTDDLGWLCDRMLDQLADWTTGALSGAASAVCELSRRVWVVARATLSRRDPQAARTAWSMADDWDGGLGHLLVAAEVLSPAGTAQASTRQAPRDHA